MIVTSLISLCLRCSRRKYIEDYSRILDEDREGYVYKTPVMTLGLSNFVNTDNMYSKEYSKKRINLVLKMIESVYKKNFHRSVVRCWFGTNWSRSTGSIGFQL